MLKRPTWNILMLALVVFLLIFQGIGVAETEKGTTVTYVKKPAISAWTICRTPAGDFLTTLHYQLTGNSIKMYGNEISFTIDFDREMDEKSISQGIKVNGFKDIIWSIEKFNGKTSVEGSIPKVEMDKQYQLTIAKSVQDVQGHTLQTDVQVNVTFVTYPSVSFTCIEADGTLVELGVHSEFESLNLTTSPKTFLANFATDVNQKSVEQYLNSSLKRQKLQYKLTWLKTRQLKVELRAFQAGEIYHISLEGVNDLHNKPIFGELYMFVERPNSIGYVELGSYKSKVVAELKERLYMARQMPYIDDLLILDTWGSQVIFNLKTGKITGEYLGGGSYFYANSEWLDSDTMIANGKIPGITRYSLHNNSEKRIAVTQEIMALRVSPNQKKIAVFIDSGTEPDNARADLYIYDMEGHLLHKYPEIVRCLYYEVLGPILKPVWLDNRYLIVADGAETKVSKIDILSGKKETILDRCGTPVASSGKNIVISDSRQFVIYSEGKISEEIAGDRNFYFIDENRLVYNIDSDIYLFSLKSRTAKKIGSGEIIGVSADRKRVYYITNYHDLSNFM